MLITKSEFRDQFGYGDLSNVSHLLSDGSIVANEDGKIDLDDPVNKKFIRKRKQKLRAQAKKENDFDQKQLQFESDLSDQRLLERKHKNTLLEMKIAKERGEVVESAVLAKVVNIVFETLFKQLTEMPLNITDQIIDIVRTEDEPKEVIVKFMVDTIKTHIQSGLKLSESTAKKYYEQQYFNEKSTD